MAAPAADEPADPAAELLRVIQTVPSRSQMKKQLREFPDAFEDDVLDVFRRQPKRVYENRCYLSAGWVARMPPKDRLQAFRDWLVKHETDERKAAYDTATLEHFW